MMTETLPTTLTKQTSAPFDPKSLGRFHTMPYTDSNRAVWRETIEKRTAFAQKHSHDVILRGLKIFNITPNEIPNLREIDQILFQHTGWHVLQIDAAFGDRDIYFLAGKKIRPVNALMRSDLENSIIWPDLIHDLFHLFNLLDENYSQFMTEAGALYAMASDRGKEQLALSIRRIFWQFSEFGVLQTQQGYKAFGPVLNDTADGEHLMTHQSLIRLGSVSEAANTPFPWEVDSSFQVGQPMKVYLACKSFEDLLSDFRRWRPSVPEAGL